MNKKDKKISNVIDNEVTSIDNEVTSIDNENNLKSIDEVLSGYKQEATYEEPVKKRGRPKKLENEKEKVEINTALNGALFLLIIDLIIPNLICFINNSVSEKKINSNQLQLTEAQKRDLTPLADEISKKIGEKANPLAIFIISLIGIYSINFMMLKNE